MKALSHYVQPEGLSPKCVAMCDLKLSALAQKCKHCVQLKCLTVCALNVSACVT